MSTILILIMNLLKSSGEPGCIAMKEEIIANHSLFPISEKNALSTCSIRKIDAIVIAEMQKEKVELSSNEWKKNYVSSRGFRYGRGNGAGGSFFGQRTPQRWGNQQNSYTNSSHQNHPNIDKSFTELSIFVGLYELLIVSGYILQNDLISPFLGNSFGKFHFGSTIAKNIHVLEAD
jgi:hypothetical protein